jgi:hypothetical protein
VIAGTAANAIAVVTGATAIIAATTVVGTIADITVVTTGDITGITITVGITTAITR